MAVPFGPVNSKVDHVSAAVPVHFTGSGISSALMEEPEHQPRIPLNSSEKKIGFPLLHL